MDIFFFFLNGSKIIFLKLRTRHFVSVILIQIHFSFSVGEAHIQNCISQYQYNDIYIYRCKSSVKELMTQLRMDELSSYFLTELIYSNKRMLRLIISQI